MNKCTSASKVARPCFRPRSDPRQFKVLRAVIARKAFKGHGAALQEWVTVARGNDYPVLTRT